MRHKIYPLIISLVFLLDMVGLQGCFEDDYSNPGYGNVAYGGSPAYSYVPPYRSYNYKGPRYSNGSGYYRPGYDNGYRAGAGHEEREEHEEQATQHGWGHQPDGRYRD
jgi:hypothetical protein